MSEDLKRISKELGLADDVVIIPEGYDMILVPVGDVDHVESACPTCGGCSLPTSPNCVYCGNGRTHYEYKKIGSKNEEKSSMPTKSKGSILVEQGSLEGQLWADEVEIGDDSVVGNITADDNAYMGDRSKAGYIFSPITRLGKDVELSEVATSVLTGSRNLRAGIVTVYDGGQLSLSRGSKITELRLGRGVEEPGWLIKFGIKKVVHGDFPKPEAWKK